MFIRPFHQQSPILINQMKCFLKKTNSVSWPFNKFVRCFRIICSFNFCFELMEQDQGFFVDDLKMFIKYQCLSDFNQTAVWRHLHVGVVVKNRTQSSFNFDQILKRQTHRETQRDTETSNDWKTQMDRDNIPLILIRQ